MAKRTYRSVAERFWAKVDKAGDCWEWTGQRTKDGYGSFWNGARRPGPSRSPVTVLAHRWVYEHELGPIPQGHVVCHRCDNPGCVNPAHLFTGSQRDNVRDCIAKGRHRNGRSTLTATQVAEVRSLYRGEYGDIVRLAAQFGVTKKLIQSEVRDLPRVGRLSR